MICTLIDTDAGNLIGTYATEQEALMVIQGAIALYGAEYADNLALGREDADGRTKLIAEGDGLARRAQALPLSI